MSNKRHKPEEIDTKLRQIEVLVGQGILSKLNSGDVIDVLTDLFILRGVPAFIRSDNGPEFIAEVVKNGSKLSAQRPPTSYQARHGRTDTVKASMRVSGMNC